MYKHCSLLVALVVLSIDTVSTICKFHSSDQLSCNNVNLDDVNNVFDKDYVKDLAIYQLDSSILPDNALEFVNLETLTISGKLRMLSSDSLKQSSKLEKVDLSYNHLRYIPNDFFPNILQLKTFIISHNEFASPTLDTFYKMNNVQVLDLAHNSITDLILGVLDQAYRIQKLYLSHNLLTSLTLGVFDRSKNLSVLDLSYNEITDIPLGIFDQSNKIETLNLAGNQLHEIRLGLFDPLNNLLRLSVSDNQFVNLPLGVLDAPTKLKSVEISNNNLKDIPVGMFDRNSNLITINLSRNNLKNLGDELFAKNHQLKYVNARHNSINELRAKTFKRTSLMTLIVSYNELKEIKLGVLNLKSLKNLYIRNNKISYMDPLTFATHQSALKVIDVRENRLVFIDDEFFNWTANLRRFEIGGNPWDCQCLKQIGKIMAAKHISYQTAPYFNGRRPSCVVKDSLKCTATKNNTAMYYKLYITKSKVH